jgi:hypothetical protein
MALAFYDPDEMEAYMRAHPESTQECFQTWLVVFNLSTDEPEALFLQQLPDRDLKNTRTIFDAFKGMLYTFVKHKGWTGEEWDDSLGRMRLGYALHRSLAKVLGWRASYTDALVAEIERVEARIEKTLKAIANALEKSLEGFLK